MSAANKPTRRSARPPDGRGVPSTAGVPRAGVRNVVPRGGVPGDGVGGGGGGTGDDAPAVTGPVGIAEQTGALVDEQGWRPLVEFAALLSLNLGIFNALPIPMLDGGRALFVIIEILRGGRRIAPEREALVHLTGFALLMAGVLIVTWFDITRLIS